MTHPDAITLSEADLGPGGPRPQDVVQQIECPILVLWGKEDFMAPFDNPVSDFLKTWPGANFIPLSGNTSASVSHQRTAFLDTGHALHDDRPAKVHQHLLPWLEQIYISQPGHRVRQ